VREQPGELAGGVPAFARLCGRHPDHVNRACRRAMGLTASELVNELRLDRAEQLLRDPEAPVSLVAEDGEGDLLGMSRQAGVRLGIDQDDPEARSSALEVLHRRINGSHRELGADGTVVDVHWDHPVTGLQGSLPVALRALGVNGGRRGALALVGDPPLGKACDPCMLAVNRSLGLLAEKEGEGLKEAHEAVQDSLHKLAALRAKLLEDMARIQSRLNAATKSCGGKSQSPRKPPKELLDAVQEALNELSGTLGEAQHSGALFRDLEAGLKSRVSTALDTLREGLSRRLNRLGFVRSARDLELETTTPGNILNALLDTLSDVEVEVVDRELDALPEGEWDADRLVRALKELVLNAREACVRQGRAPGVKIMVRRNGGRCVFCVEDEAGGADEDLFPRLGPHPCFGGADEGPFGFGLAYARGVALAHGGSLEISVAEGGSKVQVRLEIPWRPGISAQSATVQLGEAPTPTP
jgi:signal transduction histidine kinase